MVLYASILNLFFMDGPEIWSEYYVLCTFLLAYQTTNYYNGITKNVDCTLNFISVIVIFGYFVISSPLVVRIRNVYHSCNSISIVTSLPQLDITKCCRRERWRWRKEYFFLFISRLRKRHQSRECQYLYE